MHILRQKKILCQALSNPPSLTLSPRPNTSCHRKRLVPKLEDGLLTHFWTGGGCHVRPYLGGRLGGASRFSNNYPLYYLGRWGFWKSIPQTLGRLVGCALPFPSTGRRGGEGESDFCLRVVVVALMDGHWAQNDLGSFST